MYVLLTLLHTFLIGRISSLEIISFILITCMFGPKAIYLIWSHVKTALENCHNIKNCKENIKHYHKDYTLSSNKFITISNNNYRNMKYQRSTNSSFFIPSAWNQFSYLYKEKPGLHFKKPYQWFAVAGKLGNKDWVSLHARRLLGKSSIKWN